MMLSKESKDVKKTIKSEVENKEKSKKSSRRRWIPPPALSSSIGNRKTGKSNSKSLAEPESQSTDDKHSDFEEKLKDLLREIQQLKSYVSSENNEKELLNQIMTSAQTVETLENTVHKALEELRQLQKDENVYRKSFDAVKNELQKNLEENDHLVKQQKTLVEKLNRVERNATEAVEHMIALRNFIGKLSKEGPQWKTPINSNEKYNEQILAKIQQLDEANRSLQRIISDTPIVTIPIGKQQTEESEKSKDGFTRLNESDLAELTRKVKDLQANVEDDRRQISELHITIQKVKQTSAKEKEELKKTTNLHKERANKYLSTVDALKLQLSQKSDEMNNSKREIGSLKLQIMCLASERDRLEIEKTTLTGKCRAIESQTTSQNLAMTAHSEEVSSRLLQFSSKIGVLELENEKLKMQLADSRQEIDRCKSDLRRQEEENRKQQFAANERDTQTAAADKSAQVSFINARYSPSKVTPSTPPKTNISGGQEHWMQMTELWKELQSDKLTILQVLKDLEHKLEKSQDVNSEFRRELSQKEAVMQEINLRLQEKIEENKSLKQLLESAIADAKNMSERVQEASSSLDQATRSKLADLEKRVQEYKTENSQLRKASSEAEKNLGLRVKELQERLDLVEKSKKALHEYIAFLKSSYASVFGDASLATKNYAF